MEISICLWAAQQQSWDVFNSRPCVAIWLGCHDVSRFIIQVRNTSRGAYKGDLKRSPITSKKTQTKAIKTSAWGLFSHLSDLWQQKLLRRLTGTRGSLLEPLHRNWIAKELYLGGKWSPLQIIDPISTSTLNWCPPLSRWATYTVYDHCIYL